MEFWAKLRRLKGESSSRNEVNIMKRNNLNVNEEYLEAFRTKSYMEIWSKVQGELTTVGKERFSSLSPIPTYPNLSVVSEDILEPSQEVVIELIQTAHIHRLVIAYLEGSLEAFRICGSLLRIIDKMRADHRIVQRVIKLSTMKSSVGENLQDDQCRVIRDELASYVKLENPLSVSNWMKVTVIQSRYRLMLDKLRTKCRKVRRREKIVTNLKKASAASLVIACGGISVVSLILALHSLVGIVAAPALLAIPFAVLKKATKLVHKELNTNSMVRLVAQLDAAAKGVFFLNRDFDTLGQLLAWLYDEIEYLKSRAGMCVKDQASKVLEDLVKEFHSREVRFLEKLEELEEHVYLCFLNINRFRRLVIQQATLDRSQPP